MLVKTTFSVSEMMAELDEKARELGIVWGPGEMPNSTGSERTRYAKPGQKCGRGRVRLVSPKQVAFIRRLMAEKDTRNLVRLPGSEDIESMSLKGATDLIDRLLACPGKKVPAGAAGVPGATHRPASQKQMKYIVSLMDRTGNYPSVDWANLSSREASALIDELKGSIA